MARVQNFESIKYCFSLIDLLLKKLLEFKLFSIIQTGMYTKQLVLNHSQTCGQCFMRVIHIFKIFLNADKNISVKQSNIIKLSFCGNSKKSI